MGSPRIASELAKLGIIVDEDTVLKYMPKFSKDPSPSWKTFLDSHIKSTIGIDFFTVPTFDFKILYVFVVLSHERRKILHFNITENPTSEWTAQQLTEALPWDHQAIMYLMRDNDGIYKGNAFKNRVQSMKMEEKKTAYRSPWQNPFVERLIGSIRRDCLDHMIIFHHRQLRRVLKSYFDYYHRSRTHLSLDGDCPQPRPVQSDDDGYKIISFPQVYGLHNRYERSDDLAKAA